MDHAIYTAMGAASQTLNQQAVTDAWYAGLHLTAAGCRIATGWLAGRSGGKRGGSLYP